MTEQEKKQRQLETNRKAVKKYREKTVSFAVKYSAVDANQGNVLKAYLEQTGQSANSYIKALIKADLDAKGFCVDCATMDSMDIKSLESNNDTDNS
jgi:transposase-like protein